MIQISPRLSPALPGAALLLLALFCLSCTEKEKESSPLDNKGIGPIKTMSLSPEIDPRMAEEGSKIFSLKCSTCHKIAEKYVGPPLQGITLRRSPEWIMNMILNPEQMLEEDPLASELSEAYPIRMLNQGLKEEEARSILEYLRKEDQSRKKSQKEESK